MGTPRKVSLSPECGGHFSCPLLPDVKPCSADMFAAASKECANLKPDNTKGPFYECLQSMEDEKNSYFEDCTMDYCLFQGNPAAQMESICSDHNALGQTCAGQGFSTTWRTAEFCRM